MEKFTDFLINSKWVIPIEIVIIVILAGLLILLRRIRKKRSEKVYELVREKRENELNSFLANTERSKEASPGSGGRIPGIRVTVRMPEGNFVRDFYGQKKILVGRNKGCDLVVQSPYMARRQCVLEFTGNCFTAASLSATNQLFLERGGGRKILGNQKTELYNGDILEIGDVSLRIELA